MDLGSVVKTLSYELNCEQQIAYIPCSLVLCLQVAQLSQTVRAAGWVSYGQKGKTGTEIQYLLTIWVNIQPLRRIWLAKNGNRRRTQNNKGYYTVQGHRGRY